MSTGEFAGKAVLVTGAASGLGRATSLAFARAGAKVCIVDINADGLADTTQRIAAAGGTSVSFAGDIGQPANCALAVRTAVDAFGKLDVLCNIAGILRFHALADVTPEDWNLLFSANVTSVFFMTQAAMPHLLEAEGNVVNAASTASFLGQAYTAPYTATKAAIRSLTKSLAMEFIKTPVRINAIAPGGMITEMGMNVKFPENADQELIMRYIGIRPPSTPEEIADLVLLLASDKARSVHGAIFSTDNGITAG